MRVVDAFANPAVAAELSYYRYLWFGLDGTPISGTAIYRKKEEVAQFLTRGQGLPNEAAIGPASS